MAAAEVAADDAAIVSPAGKETGVMRMHREIAIALALLLALGASGAATTQDSQLAQANAPAKRGQGPGYGMGPGMMGPGYGYGYGYGYGMGPGMMGSGYGMGPGMMGSGYGMGPGMMGRGGGPGQREGYVEGRIAFLKTELKITPDQAKLWDAYADALRASAKTMAGMHAAMTTIMTATALPERLDAVESVMTERLDAFKQTKAAALPLYAALSAEQKATADEIMPAMGMGMMGF
jgi:hypothetical protein